MKETSKIHKVVYLVRHGQSEANVTPVFQANDSPLSEAGREQARLLADRMKNIEFELLLSSPLPRAHETAEIISQATGKKVQFSDLFVERMRPENVGGKSIDDEVAAKLYREWEESLYTPGMRVAGAENYEDIVQRADSAIQYIEDLPERSIAIIMHGYFLRTIVARVVLGPSLTATNFKEWTHRVSMENAGITVLRHTEWKGAPVWRLWIYNDHAHLG